MAGDIRSWNADLQSDLKRQLLIATLYGKAENLWRFNFSLSDRDGSGDGSPVVFRPNAFLGVVDAILGGRIKLSDRIPANSVAAYDNGSNTLFVDFARVRTPTDQAAVVHECAHAVVDLFSPLHFTRLTNEAAAFLSQTVFLSVVGAGLPKVGAKDPELDQIYVEADAVARTFFLYNGTPAALRRSDFQKLRDAIAKVYTDVGAEERQLGLGVP